jgi:hypothetical protein
MQQACKPAVQPDGTSCEVAPEFSENQALCKSRQHGFVAGTECVTYTWISDSSLLCRAAAGIGPNLEVVVQINKQRISLSKSFSYDLPSISSIPLFRMPTSGGRSITIYGQAFGLFPCNRTWCSSVEVLGQQV